MKHWMLFVWSILICTGMASAEMISNGNFANDKNNDGVPDYWVNDSNHETGMQPAIVMEDGRRSLKLTRTSPNGALARISKRDIMVQPEHNYQFSIWYKSTGKAGVIIYDFLEDKTYQTMTAPCPKGEGWQKATFEFQTRPQSVSLKISLLASTVNEPAYYADAILEDLDGRPQVVVPLVDKAPALDADWEAPEWHKSVGSSAFTLLGPERKKPTAGTEVRFNISGDQLNVIYRCEEPKMSEINLGGGNWNDDTAEIYLREPSGILLQFGVTADGTCLQSLHNELSKGFATNWYDSSTTDGTVETQENIPCKTAARKFQNHWVGQFAITLPPVFRTGTRQFEILFARSRKINDLEENSSWGRTNAKFFRYSKNFVKVFQAFGKEGLSERPLVKALPLERPGERIIPTPQHLELSNQAYSYGSTVRVHAEAGAERALKAFAYLLKEKFGIEAVEAGAKDASIRLVLEKKGLWNGFDKLAPWQQAEAYSLATGDKAVARATTHRGLVYAMQSLLQLSCRNDAGELYCRKAEIQDWPDMESRGWHLLAPEHTSQIQATYDIIRTMSALKMNWISLQFDSRFRYERRPDLGLPNAPSKEVHRKFGELIDLLGMDVIPMTQCISHFNYFLARPEYRKFAELQIPDPKSSVKYWNYCPRHPEIHQLVFDMIEEHLECYPKAKWYHIGTDEITFEPWGVCERCKGTPCGKLLADEVKVLHDFLAKKGLRTCVWSDQYLFARNGAGVYQTAEATKELPRDIVMFDWHYGELKEYPSVEILQKQGFTVIGNGWYFPANISPFIDVLFKQNALGFGGTTWTAIDIFRKKPHLMTAMVVGAERTWKRDAPPISEFTFHPTEAFRIIYQKETKHRPQAFRPLDIEGWCNMSFTGKSASPWFGLGVENDASMLPTGRQFLAGIPFDIAIGSKGAIQLACATDKDDDAFPEAAAQIPVGGKVRGLSFLHTASVPPAVIRTLHDQSKRKPAKPAKYVIHFEDGSSETVELAWEKEITSWNTQIGTAVAPIAWSGKTAAGALINLCAYTWENPKPELAVTAIDFISHRDIVRPVLIAVTAIEK